MRAKKNDWNMLDIKLAFYRAGITSSQDIHHKSVYFKFKCGPKYHIVSAKVAGLHILESDSSDGGFSLPHFAQLWEVNIELLRLYLETPVEIDNAKILYLQNTPEEGWQVAFSNGAQAPVTHLKFMES
ncbi:hypothetical protein [Kamptonema formosum]|uniref:hypothetical protein n=1 Tax=Kamptonema formosum TaxID=331992 RepID=UPI0004780BBB|nr:hypothetical protein [Oscillatoria sp. PCC 10802]